MNEEFLDFISNFKIEDIVLKEGDTGDVVLILQQKLKQAGYFPGTITGSYGPDTKESVEAFQRHYNLPVTGTVDNETFRVLFSATDSQVREFKDLRVTSRPTLRRGDTGDSVVELQERLTTLLYYSGAIDGIFGSGTESAVKGFQLINNIAATGIVDNNTWSALEELYAPLAICGNGEEVDFDEYIVKSGDTLYSIARRFNTTVSRIKEINNLTSDVLSVGQRLYVPTTETIPPEPEDNFIIHLVRSGDTLFSIARQYGTTVNEIKRLNNLTSDLLSIGQQLRIPATTPEIPEIPDYTIHTVVSGDTLYSLSRRYGVSVTEIRNANNLTSDLLSIGQQLRIPVSTGGVGTTTHTVVPGDTLFSIAKRYNTTVDNIKKLNGLTSNMLSIGQRLVVLS